jgi:hypothetical protein
MLRFISGEGKYDFQIEALLTILNTAFKEDF